MRYVIGGILSSLAVLVLMTGMTTGQDAKKITVKQVMKEHKKGALRAKVLKGGASEAERKKLVDLYKAACACTPKKGEKKEWVARWKKIVAAATAVAKDDTKKGRRVLAKATNCKGCHSKFK